MALVSIIERAKELGDVGGALTAAGTTQATATSLNGDHVSVTSGSDGQGIRLKAANALDLRSVSNQTANSIIVYPPVGASFNGVAANTGLVLPANRGALFFFRTALDITAVF